MDRKHFRGWQWTSHGWEKKNPKNALQLLPSKNYLTHHATEKPIKVTTTVIKSSAISRARDRLGALNARARSVENLFTVPHVPRKALSMQIRCFDESQMQDYVENTDHHISKIPSIVLHAKLTNRDTKVKSLTRAHSLAYLPDSQSNNCLEQDFGISWYRTNSLRSLSPDFNEEDNELTEEYGEPIEEYTEPSEDWNEPIVGYIEPTKEYKGYEAVGDLEHNERDINNMLQNLKEEVSNFSFSKKENFSNLYCEHFQSSGKVNRPMVSPHYRGSHNERLMYDTLTDEYLINSSETIADNPDKFAIADPVEYPYTDNDIDNIGSEQNLMGNCFLRVYL